MFGTGSLSDQRVAVADYPFDITASRAFVQKVEEFEAVCEETAHELRKLRSVYVDVL